MFSKITVNALRRCSGLTAALLLIFCRLAQAGDGAPLLVKHSQNTDVIPRYEVFEITFQHDEQYDNPFFDVTIDVSFKTPSGKTIAMGGFYYGARERARIARQEQAEEGPVRAEYSFDKADIWKARFAPSELGKWTYSFVFANSRGRQAAGSGGFTCIKGRVQNPGFVRQDPHNTFRWVFDDGSPFFPIGYQGGVSDSDGTGTVLDSAAMEGPFRLDRRGRPDPPAGAMFRPGPSNNPLNADVQFRSFSRCGFNLIRFSQQNNSLSLNRDLDHYLVQEAVMVDRYLQCARKYGFRIFYGIFGFQKAFNDQPDNSAAMEKVKRFIQYSANRWGAYVDFWEFLNEQKADDRWYGAMAPFLASIDPYHHPIATSWERPDLPGIQVNAPHWYVNVGKVSDSDRLVQQRAAAWKNFGKPVIVGEHGNHADADLTKRPPGVGGVWDPESHLRMRVRNWTALFNEIAFIFWNTSYAKDGHYMNIWLGPKERQYVKAMQDYAYGLGAGARIIPVHVSDPKQVRAYGLASDSRAGAYLVNTADRAAPENGLNVTLDVPKAGRAWWYSPEDGAVLARFHAAAGAQTIPVPPFALDVALLIGADHAPDSDNDGQPNDVDKDDDNDGVPDLKDAFPLEPEEWEDKDGDLIGDNIDADDNADGIGDDLNHNGTPDNEELDFDGDGADKCHAVPWDAFPLDPKEWRDTDGDAIGDNADPDDDNDGYLDAEETRAGTDPFNNLRFPFGR